MQLKLFERNVIFDVTLQADSSKHAFYRLKLVLDCGRYIVEKESGASGKVLDRRQWPQADRRKAERFFNRKLAVKLKPGRKSPRQYYIPELLRKAG